MIVLAFVRQPNKTLCRLSDRKPLCIKAVRGTVMPRSMFLQVLLKPFLKYNPGNPVWVTGLYVWRLITCHITIILYFVWDNSGLGSRNIGHCSSLLDDLMLCQVQLFCWMTRLSTLVVLKLLGTAAGIYLVGPFSTKSGGNLYEGMRIITEQTPTLCHTFLKQMLPICFIVINPSFHMLNIPQWHTLLILRNCSWFSISQC